MDGLIRITPDIEKAKSILKMAEETNLLIQTIDSGRFPSHVVKEYYDIMRETASAILLLDGLKTKGDGAHKKLIEYVKANYSSLTEYDTELFDALRVIRNKITYDGFFIRPDYLNRNRAAIESLAGKLKEILDKKLKA